MRQFCHFTSGEPYELSRTRHIFEIPCAQWGARCGVVVKEESDRLGRKLFEGVGVEGPLPASRDWVMPPSPGRSTRVASVRLGSSAASRC